MSGVSHQRTTGRGGAVTVTGEVSLVDMSTFTRLGSTQTVVAMRSVLSMEEARREAFSRFGLTATSLLYRYLYRRDRQEQGRIVADLSPSTPLFRGASVPFPSH